MKNLQPAQFWHEYALHCIAHSSLQAPISRSIIAHSLTVASQCVTRIGCHTTKPILVPLHIKCHTPTRAHTRTHAQHMHNTCTRTLNISVHVEAERYYTWILFSAVTLYVQLFSAVEVRSTCVYMYMCILSKPWKLL